MLRRYDFLKKIPNETASYEYMNVNYVVRNVEA